MPHDIQIVVDAADPHALAEWWAETLEWEVEPSDEAFIKDMIAKGFATEDDTKTHRGTLVWKKGAAIRHPENRRRILFQAVPEVKTVKNRVHLDVFVGQGHREAEHEKLLGRGATFLWRGQEGPTQWITMADPEGNEFCVN
jgi:hypothetical protein